MARRSERERLTQLIQQWNVDHYDLFELSAPNEDLEFHGAVRFYFQGGDGANVITKCVRVSSTATTQDVIETLIEKFRPDMRMLTQNKYALYEVHVNGEERRLADGEKPLWVQLNWGKDVREGRFLLKNENEKTLRDPALGFEKEEPSNFKRKLSKREKKEKKKREAELAKQNDSMASKLYSEAPETSFTRSISNPEAVMRRRRQQKLEKKLAQMQSREGGPDSGGTLKIYGESLQPDVPYKTLLLSTADTTLAVIKEAMEKYGLEKEDPEQFCLVEVLLPPGSLEYHGGNVGEERVLDDGECPLAIVMQHPKQRGHIIFQLRRRSADYKKRSKRPRAVSHDDLRKAHDHPATQADKLPYLIELNPRDGRSQKHLLPLNVTEVVRDRPMTPGNQFLPLSGPDIRPRHCVIAHTEGIVTITPTARDAEVYVEQQRIFETTMLRHGMTVQFGRSHVFRFVDPRFEEATKPTHPVPAPRTSLPPQETNFDLDGHVETVATSPHSQPRPQERGMNQGRSPGLHPSAANGHEFQPDLLPASLEYRLEAEDRLLQAVILNVNSRAVQFKLAPTYTLYMAIRRLLVARMQVNMAPAQHSQMVADFVSKTSKLIQQAIQEHHNDPTALAFWMANASEVLHFYKQDLDVQPYGADSQELLAEAVQMAFHHLVRCLQGDLQRVMPAFLDPSDDVDDENAPLDHHSQGRPMLADVLNTLSAAMTLLRRCRVNAALTIQLFSQLFHFINMWLFNILVMEPQLQLCTRVWGLRLKRRLGRVEAWAEKQGLELAADCHLCRIIQAAHLLQAPKITADDITNISSTCFKLNSMQLRALLTRYIPDRTEPPVSPTFIERVVVIAENMADELTRTDGREVRLEEDPDLHLPFLLPEDGYSCDTIRGIPSGLPEFVTQLTSAGICHLVANNKASGSWTVYMGSQLPQEAPRSPQGNQPEILTVSFKKVKGSMGLSIVAAIGEGVQERGIYIKSVVPGGAAALDGRLKAGDQLLEVDGKSLVGLSQDKAAELMTQTGDVVTLRVAKQGAIYHGLATLLSEPSPTMPRHPTKVGPGGLGEEGPPPYMDPRQNSPGDPQRGQRPVPQPRGQSNLASGKDNLDRMRSPSAGNLSNQQYPHQPPEPSNYNRRDIDPRSKSTSNLHVDTSFDRTDPHANMRGAASVSVLHPGGPVGYSQYSPGARRPDIRPNDYENQPQVSPGSGHGGHQDINQNVKPGVGPNQQQLHPASHRPSDRSSVSSRASSNSARDMRPQSAYYDAQAPRDDYNNFASRPKSEEVTANKLRDWQDKYEPQAQGYRGNDGPNHISAYANQNQGYRGNESASHSPPYINHNQVYRPNEQANQGPPPGNQNQGYRGNDNSPPYTNIGAVTQNRTQQQQPEPRPSAHQRLFGNQGGPPAGGNIPKVSQSNQQRQPNFYENTQPAMQEPAPPFHQLQRPPSESDKPKPAVMTKPAIAKKPGPKVQPTDIPIRAVDNRQTQPGFYGNQRPSPQPQQGGSQQYQHGYPDSRPPHDVDRLDARGMHQDPRAKQHQDPRFMQQPQDSKYMQQPQDPRSMQQDPRAMQHDPRTVQQDPRGGYSMQKFPSNRGDPGPYGYPATHSNMQDHSISEIPPELPPPPDEEDLPPLPPPPVQDPYEQQLQEEQQRLMDSMSGRNMDPVPPSTNLPSSYDRYGQPVNAGYNGQGYDPHSVPTSSYQPHIMNQQQPQLQQQQLQQAPNYQNINFVSEVHASTGPASQVPAPEHNVYEPYNSRSQPPPQQLQHHQAPPPSNQSYDSKPSSLYQPQQQIHPQQNQQQPQPSPLTPTTPSLSSAWDRDEREKAQEQQAEEMFRAREAEIAELESRSYLSIQDQERLRKLKLEHEFQRRVREIDEKGDYDADDNDETMDCLYTRERLIQSLKEDLEKSRQRSQELDRRQMIQDAQIEKERVQRLERRLEVMEKDRQEMRERIEKRQQRRTRDHQEQLRQQREAREKQRQNYEEQKRLLMMEEEKMRQRREEEINKRRMMERERLQEMQIARDNEEARLRAEIRRQNDDYVTQQMLQQRQQRMDQNRDIRVADEKRRIEAIGGGGGQNVGGVGTSNASQPSVSSSHLNNGVGGGVKPSTAGPGYQQYMNLPPSQQQIPEKENLAPPPPERTSSYNTAAVTRNNLDYTSLPFPGQQPQQQQQKQQQQQQQQQQPQQSHLPPALTKKTVSFNTDLNTYQNRTPSHSFSSEHNMSPSSEQSTAGPNDVFSAPSSGAPTSPSYVRQDSTPGVIGTQEVYRDPRNRIEAQKAAQSGPRKQANERMSFRDKMKYFAQEAGEDTPKYKPKASKTLRNIESQLNGQ